MILLLLACHADPLTEVPDFGDNPGNLRMYERPPDGGPAPLILVLHGCLQDHDFAADAGLLSAAPDAVIIAAEQRLTNNPEGCFNWFLAGDTTRTGGEVASLASMITSARSRYDVNPTRIGVVGVSAGGAMANALLATWPDLLTAGVVVAGAPVGCADTLGEAAGCLLDPSGRSDEAWSEEVRARGTGGDRWPRVSVVQGEADVVVAPVVSDVILAQWAGVHGVEAGAVDTFQTSEGTATHTVYGEGQVESLRYEGVGHTMPVDPDAGCGRSGPFLADIDECLAARVVTFLAPP